MIGLSFVSLAADQGHEVSYTGFWTGYSAPLAEYIGKDIQPESLKGFDAVVHLAAITDPLCDDQDAIQKTNIDASLRLFKTAEKAKVPTVVYASSGSVYGQNPTPFEESDDPSPLCMYAESKLLLDNWTQERQAKTAYLGLRFANIYGPYERHKGTCQSMVYQLANQMLFGDPRLYANGEQRRDWLYVEDCAKAILLACQAERSEILNIGSGTNHSFNDIVDTINTILETDRSPIYIPNPHPERYQSETLHDISKAQRVLEWKPSTDLDFGIRKTFRRMRQLGEL